MRLKRGEVYYGDEGTYEGKSLCEACYFEDEACATVFYKGGDQPYVISQKRRILSGNVICEFLEYLFPTLFNQECFKPKLIKLDTNSNKWI
jgi:hypothetical protein